MQGQANITDNRSVSDMICQTPRLRTGAFLRDSTIRLLVPLPKTPESRERQRLGRNTLRVAWKYLVLGESLAWHHIRGAGLFSQASIWHITDIETLRPRFIAG